MKNIFYILLLLPTIIFAQYPSNSGQKITLGEQTTADGLVYRGLAADTTRKPSVDTMAYILLDTNTNIIWQYKKATNNAWTRVGGSISSGVTGVLPVANGGTGSATQNFVDLTTGQTVAGIKQFTNIFAIKSATNDSFKIEFTPSNISPNFELYGGRGSDAVGGSAYWRLRDFVNARSWIGQISSAGNLDFYFNYGGSFFKRHTFTKEGNVGIGTASPTEKLDVVGNGLFTGSVTANSLSLTTPLSVANGGTGQSTLAANKIMVGNTTSGVLTPSNLHWDNTNSRLGIGTSSPARTLDVNGELQFKNALVGEIIGSGPKIVFSQTANNPYWISIVNNNDTGRFICGVEGAANTSFTGSSANSAFFGSNRGDLHIISDGKIYQTIKTTGNVGIGTTSPQSGYKLHVVDSVYVGGNVSASAYTTRSDYDLKDEIQNISYGINEVMQMQPVKYTYKSNGSSQLGFIAQDLGVITPEVVSFEDKMSVYYNALIPILTKAIQEQNALIKALEQRIINLENK